MEMFSEVEWKKSNATTQEPVCHCRSESVLRSVETWISDSYGVRFGPQVVKTFVTTKCFKGFFHRELLENFSSGVRSETCIEAFLMSTRHTHFENIHKVPAMDLVHHHN